MSDAFVKLLNSKGYQPVLLPRSGLVPPDLYTFTTNRLARWGSFGEFLPKDVTFVAEVASLPDIEYKYTSSKKQSAAVSFLKAALACVGIESAPKLDLSFAGGIDMMFAFSGVTLRAVSAGSIARAVARLNHDSLPKEVVDGGEVHIAYEYVYAKSLLMSRKDMKSFDSGVAGAIGNYFDLGARGTVNLASQTTISFSPASGTEAAFALKVGQIRRDISQKWKFYAEESMLSGKDGREGGGGEGSTPAAKRIPVLARGRVLKVEFAGSGPGTH